jgi:5-amino-6-(5-phosphoribosylamino)uracil reductase
VTTGDAHVEPELALGALHQRGARVVVCEGGPTLNGSLLERDVVDELCLTVSPTLVSGADPRIARGTSLGPPDRLALDRILVEDGFVYLRYLRDRSATAP